MRKSVIQLFGGNLLSKLLGLGREVLAATLFGTGQVIGAYRVAQTGTLVPINFFTSDSLNSAFIPQYKRFLAVSRDMAQTLFWLLVFLFGFLALFLGFGLWFLAGPWVALLAPGLVPDTAVLTLDMLRIMSVGVPFYLMSALLMFLSMANGDFVPMAVRPSMQNLGLILGAILAFALKNAMFLAWGFTSAYVVYSAWVIFRAWHSGFLVFPREWGLPRTRDVLGAFWRTLRPLLFLPVLLQGNIAVERAVASLIGLAVISGLDYAKFVTETLIILVSMPVAFAGLAHWSELSPAEMRRRLGRVLLLLLLVAVPASAFLIANSHVVVKAVYARGAFDASSVRVTGDILFGIALGLWAQVIGYVFIKALNAQLRNRVVLRVMALAVLANTAFNLMLYPHFGPMTLGLGNTAYALVLLAGTLTALGLWREAFASGWLLVLGVIGYLMLNQWLPMNAGLWPDLGVAIGFVMLYWVAFVALVPRFRKPILDVVMLKLRKAT